MEWSREQSNQRRGARQKREVGGDGQTRDLEREKLEAGFLKNPPIQHSLRLCGSSREGGMMEGEQERSGRRRGEKK